MSFIEGFLQLPQGLEAAYKKAAEDGQGGVLPADIISELAENLGDSIHDYMKTAMVSTIVTVEPGQTAMHPVSGKANYTTPGLGAGIGTIRFEEDSVDDLKDEIRIALEKQGDEGKATGCDPIEILENLAERLTEAIHKFALTSVVETEVTLAGGVTLVGYVTPAGAPLPAASLPTTPGLATGLGDPAQVSGTGLS